MLTNITNLVSNAGVVATDTTGVGTARQRLAAASYGGDKAIFLDLVVRFVITTKSYTNLVSNAGVVASDQLELERLDLISSRSYGSGQGYIWFGSTDSG